MHYARVFITGCARSGTTLLNRLFYAFDGVHVEDSEISLDSFRSMAQVGCVIVAKRTPQTILSVPLPRDELHRQATIVESEGIGILNIVRDGRDVVHQHSAGPRVNVNRWTGCMLQALRFCQIISLQVRYEALVRRPDAVQRKIADTFGLTPHASFSRYPDFVDPRVFEEPDYRDYAPYRRRPIDQASIGHAPLEYTALCSSDEERGLFERMLARFGYLNLPDSAGSVPGDLEQDQALFEVLSNQLGYGCS